MKVVKPRTNRQTQPSMLLQKKQVTEKAMRDGQMQDDLGLLPDTFVLPRWKNMPSPLSNFKGWRRLQWYRLKVRVQEVLSGLLYRFWMVRPTPRVHWSKIPGQAEELHKRMYTLFAEGNLVGMESRICSGLLSSLKARLGQRVANTHLRWTLHKYLSKSRIMSYKSAVIPAAKGETSRERNGVVQVVVRIHSLQSLQHVKRVTARDQRGKSVVKEVVVDAQGREVPESEGAGAVPKDAKESIEYFVVQKSLRKSKEGPWMVWGTAEEMTLDRLKKMKPEQKGTRAVAVPTS